MEHNNEENTNRFMAIMDRLGKQDSTLTAILEQTTKTNGRLGRAEGSIEELKVYQNKQKGFIAAVMLVSSIIGGLITAFIAGSWEVLKHILH